MAGTYQTLPNDPMFPRPDDFEGNPGITLREYFAAMAMQGFLHGQQDSEFAAFRAKDAVIAADALIEALNAEVPA